MSGTLAPSDPMTNGSVVPGTEGEEGPTDQEQFDATVARDGWIFLRVLGGVGIFAALAISIIALFVASGKHTTTMTMPASTAPAAALPSGTTPAAPAGAPTPTIALSVQGGNKKGPDGKLHDSFSKTNFAVKVGQPTRLRIDNKDSGSHSITAPGTGVSITVRPGLHTYTVVATNAGRFEWVCVIPCDSEAGGWAMTHPGYMAGYITAS
jgi:uncharacterized cupredoxin-like copper-binding protein